MIEDLLLLFAGLLGFITLLMILFGYKSNRLVNLYIALIILFFSLRFTLIGLKDLTKNSFLNEFIKQFNIFFIYLAAFIYLYFKNLINSQKNFVFKDLFHFIMPTLFIIAGRYTILESVFNIKINGLLLYLFAVYVIIYNTLIFVKLRRHVWYKTGSLEIVIKQNALIRKWSMYLFIALTLITMRLLVSLFLETGTSTFISGQQGIWITAIIWIIILVKILISPEILYGYSFLQRKEKENKNYISPRIVYWTPVSKVKIINIQDIQLRDKVVPNIENYINDIEKSIESSTFFRNTKFSLTDFASKLNIPKSHLSYLFKYHSKISFSDYKKIIRIEDALNLIQDNYLKANTFDSLAKKVGFASYNPFFTSFKDIVGAPPQEYCSALERSES